MKIVIKDVEYTAEEAKELYMELSKIFGENKEPVYWPYPRMPYMPQTSPKDLGGYNPLSPPWFITCENASQ